MTHKDRDSRTGPSVSTSSFSRIHRGVPGLVARLVPWLDAISKFNDLAVVDVVVRHAPVVVEGVAVVAVLVVVVVVGVLTSHFGCKTESPRTAGRPRCEGGSAWRGASGNRMLPGWGT